MGPPIPADVRVTTRDQAATDRLAAAFALLTGLPPAFFDAWLWDRSVDVEYTDAGVALWRAFASRERARVVAPKGYAFASPREFWEACAARGLTPLEWAADARRWFYHPHAPVGVPIVAPWPPTFEAAVFFAGDPGRAATAEALARETDARVDGAAGMRPRCDQVLWRPDGLEKRALRGLEAGRACVEAIAALGPVRFGGRCGTWLYLAYDPRERADYG